MDNENDEFKTERNAKVHYRFLAVKKAIDEWDPYSLLPEAPEDEYDLESREIADNVYPAISINTLAVMISEVFNYWFADDWSVDMCMKPALMVRENLNGFYGRSDVKK